jgi:putative oxidoreductase
VRETARSLLDVVTRVSVGYLFVSGALDHKVTGTRFVRSFQDWGFPQPQLLAPAVGWCELVFGALLALGAFSRLSASVLAAVMVGSLWKPVVPQLRHDHPGLGDFLSALAYTPEWLLLLLLLGFAFLGSGRYSADWSYASRKGGR